MVEVFSPGQMVGDMMASISMIESKGKAFSLGQMDAGMRGAGSMENSMESVCIIPLRERPKKVNGARAKGSVGYQPSRTRDLFQVVSVLHIPLISNERQIVQSIYTVA
jgi:hypothetical protein